MSSLSKIRRRPDPAAGSAGAAAGGLSWWAWLGRDARRWGPTAAIAIAILVVAGLAFSADPAGPSTTRLPEAAMTGQPDRPEAVAPTTTEPPSSGSPTASPTATSSSAAALPPPAAGPTSPADARPDPYVRDYAQQPGVAPLPPQPSPTAGVPVPIAARGGCDPNYVGASNACVPVNIPYTDKCEYITSHGLDGVRVREGGVDSQGLDPDGNGIVCDND